MIYRRLTPMKWISIGLTALLLSSCATCWRGGDPLRPTELASHAAVKQDLAQAKHIRVFQGLVHPQREPEAYAAQLKQVPHVFWGGFAFHRQPLAVSPQLIKDVVDLYSDPTSHQVLASPKTTCAGFHPDYALVWSDSCGTRVLQICYGCHEWKYLGPGGTLHTDINEPAYFHQLTRWLPRHP
jgi:hypothetical protein